MHTHTHTRWSMGKYRFILNHDYKEEKKVKMHSTCSTTSCHGSPLPLFPTPSALYIAFLEPICKNDILIQWHLWTKASRKEAKLSTAVKRHGTTRIEISINNLRKQPNSQQRPKDMLPRVVVVRRFHCMLDLLYMITPVKLIMRVFFF